MSKEQQVAEAKKIAGAYQRLFDHGGVDAQTVLDHLLKQFGNPPLYVEGADGDRATARRIGQRNVVDEIFKQIEIGRNK